MMPGFGERERQALELRRRDLLAEVARERLATAGETPSSGGSRPSLGGLRRWVGGWTRGAADGVAVMPMPAVEAPGSGR